jgi:biopolymer transport protein ExbB
MPQGPFKSKNDRSALRQLALAITLVFAVFCFGPAGIAQQGTAPTGVSQLQDQATSPNAGAVRESNASANTSNKLVAVGMRELSPWSMFVSASLIVQAIMAGLVFASLVTWTIFVAKFIELFIAKRRLQEAVHSVAGARTLGEASSMLSSDRSVMRSFVAAAIEVIRLSPGLDSDVGVKERVASSFSEITRSEARRVRFGMGMLATIGATAPFVGLFGTVWGIMNSFIGISKLQTTNLAVVAPGIAEALLATAIGLFAAIPAVMIYNHFSRVTRGYLDLVGRAGGTVMRQLSRDLDRMHATPMRRAAE